MDDFSVKPGSPNDYGLLAVKLTASNHKTYVKFYDTHIVEKNNALFLVVGSPGVYYNYIGTSNYT